MRTQSASAMSTRRVRWRRFGLRTFLLLIGILCVGLGVAAYFLHSAQQQRRAVQWIRQQGGDVWYEHEITVAPEIITMRKGAPPPVSDWWLDQLGVDFFCRVVLVRSRSPDLRPIASLRNVRWLIIESPELKDISDIAGMQRLEMVQLQNTQVIDLTPLSGLPNLKDVSVTGGPFDDLSPLATLNLEVLNVDNTNVSDLSPIASNESMTGLYINGTQVRDLSPLVGMTNLRRFYANDTPVDDIRPLAQLSGLKTVSLCGTDAADISPLENLRQLDYLLLQDSLVPDAEIDRIRNRLPQCKVNANAIHLIETRYPENRRRDSKN